MTAKMGIYSAVNFLQWAMPQAKTHPNGLRPAGNSHFPPQTTLP